MQIVLTNVVVAVLLDKFVADDGGDKEEGEGAKVTGDDFLGGMDGEDDGAEEHEPAPAARAGKYGHSSPVKVAPSPGFKGSRRPSNELVDDGGGGGSAHLDEKLTLVLQELAALRKEVRDLRAGRVVNAVETIALES